MTLTLIRGSAPGGSIKPKSSISVEKPSKQFPSENSFAGPKNHAFSTNFSKGSPRSLKLFVHLLETGKTLVSLVPFKMTLGSFIQAVLIEAGLAPLTKVTLTLNGKPIKLVNSTLLLATGLRNSDTLMIKSGNLLGGS